MSTSTKSKLAKNADGTYSLGDYKVRKQVQADLIDRYASVPAAVRANLFYPPAPKPRGWMVEHPSFDPQWVSTLKDAEGLIERHRHGFWESRAEAFAEAIDDDFSEVPVSRISQFVTIQVEKFGITMADFIELDERPGQFRVNGRPYEDGHWHRNLRVTRNDPTNYLFEALKVNSTR